MKKNISIIAIILSAFLLQGCIAATIGTAVAVTAKTASDPRSTGTQVDDTTLDSRVGLKMKNNANDFKDSHIVVATYNGDILLVGQAKTQFQIDKATELALSVEGVNRVYNQVRLTDVIGLGTLSNDSWITTKVKSQLFGHADTKARNIKVVTENSEVFLMGIVSRAEGAAATKVASKVSGVTLVTTIFTYSD